MKKKVQVSRIKTKAIIYIIVPVVISFSIICSVLFVSLFRTQQNLVRIEFDNIVRKHSSLFENKISNAIDYLSFVASVLEFQVNEGITDRESLQKMLFSIFESHPNIDGSSIYFEPNMYDNRDSEFRGTQFGTRLSGRICFYYYRVNGRTSYLPEALENDIEFTQPQYIDAKTLNAPVYTEPTMFEIDGEDVFMFIIVYPIRDRNNEFIGAITADIHLGEIYAQLQAEEIYSTGYILIANDRHQLIYSPRFEDIGKMREEVGLTYHIPTFIEDTIFFEIRSIVNYKRSLIAVSKIHVPQLDSHFLISVAAPFSEINANGTRLMIIVISLSVVIVTMIALLLIYLIGRMTNPIKEFKESADKIAQGDYSIRIAGDYKDEFAVLKDTVNIMAGRIESHMKESHNALKILKNILKGIDAYIYVSIPTTGELLFINDRMKQTFNLDDNVIGQPCYKVLQRGFDSMCEFCPCPKLDKDPDMFVTWEEFNTVTNRFYHNTDCYIDWIDGTKVHLQHSVDITDVKKITEEKMKAEGEALELAKRKEQAEETSRMKSVFLASMSHEIRTPMHGIIGFSELALDDNISTKTRSYLSKIKTSAESLLMIINDILDVSKIEAGKMELEKIPFDVSEVFKLCRMIASPKAREKGLTLFCYAEPSIGRILLGDPTRLRQVLLNLLSNAIKFTNNGMIKLMSAITAKTEDTITMHFEIKDSGIGMTEEQVSRIFQPFVQADDSTTRKFGGTGLGLTITNSFVELMGGKLEVESSYGLGSRFSFDITFDTIDSASGLSQISTIMNIDEKPIFDGEILVCEDNTLNQMVISDHLSKVGIKAVIAGNGRIGIDFIRERIENGEKPFDLIFMDIHMPEMDGLEAARKLVEMENKVPIIALTANIMANDRELYFESGMCDCLPKPFVAHDLWSCLLKYLKPVSMLSIKQETDLVEEEEQRMELITAFVKSNQNTIKDINDAIETGDLKLAHRLAHTLKGVAGIVGMTALVEASQVVEHSLSTGKLEFLTDQMNMLENELKGALSKLAPFMHEHSGKIRNKNANVSLNKESALKLLEKLDSFLASDSFDSLNLVKDLGMIPGTEQLAEQVEGMKFRQARETLAIIKKQVEHDQQ